MEPVVRSWRTASPNPILGPACCLLDLRELSMALTASVTIWPTASFRPRTSNFRSPLPKSGCRVLPIGAVLLAGTFRANPLVINGQLDKPPAKDRHLLDNRRVPWDLLMSQGIYPFQQGVA